MNSETTDVQTAVYFDPEHVCKVTLIDSPGFDDSRDGVTDTDILERITNFLNEG